MTRNIATLCLIKIIVSCMGFGILTLAEPSAGHMESAQVYDVETTEPPTVIPVKPQKIKKKPAYFTDVKDGKITISSLKSICKHVGKQYDIDPDLLHAIVFVESDYKVNCDGTSGDKGLCQIVERFHTERMEKLSVADIYDPYSNILLCADFLAELKASKYGSDIYYVLMAYNMGLNGATEHYEAGTISKYAYKVMREYENLKGDD